MKLFSSIASVTLNVFLCGAMTLNAGLVFGDDHSPASQPAAEDSQSSELPTLAEIKDNMELANQYFMNKWPDPSEPIVSDKTRTSNLWTRGTYYEGLMALYDLDAKQAYYDYAVDWGEGNDWSLRFGTESRHADPQCAGQTYIDLYRIDPQPERIEKIKASIDAMVDSEKSDDWDWIDAIQMAMPVFAKFGADTGEQKYFDRMHDLYMHSKTEQGDGGLYNTEEHLWWRDANFKPPYTTPEGKQCYWSRGNGWVFAALVRVMNEIPDNLEYRTEYETTFKEMAAALLPLQREDGFWNASLVDPEHFGGPETSGTAFFVYGYAWGIRHGLLDREIYLPATLKGWNALTEDALHDNGFLGYVQSTGDDPSDGQPVTYEKAPNFEDYGCGAFLLAGSEMYMLMTVLNKDSE